MQLVWMRWRLSRHKCAPPSRSSLRSCECIIWTPQHYNISPEKLFMVRYKRTDIRLSVRGDSNFPEGVYGWGHVILGKLEWGCRISYGSWNGGARPSDKSLYVIAKGTAHGPCSLHEDLPVGA